MTRGPKNRENNVRCPDRAEGLRLGADRSASRTCFRRGIDRSPNASEQRTATVFGIPIVVSTSATKVYSGPLMPAIQAAIREVVAIDRRNMNMWEDDAARGAIVATGGRKLIFLRDC